MSVKKTKSSTKVKKSYQEDRLRMIFENSPIAIWEEDFSALAELRKSLKAQKIKDTRAYLLKHRDVVANTFRQLKVLDVNKAALELYGASTKKDLLSNLGKTVHRDVLRVLVDEFAALIDGAEYFESEFKSKTLAGKVHDVRIRVKVPAIYKKTFERVIVTLHDVSVQKKYEASLKKLAQIDGLTEVYNHTTILKRLDEEFKRAQRYGKNLSCLMIDLDHFKGINDLCGHQRGDKVLKQSAAVIKDHIREVDVLGRYGGDEFLVILPETPLNRAGVVADRLIKIFDELSQSKNKTTVFSTVSVGIGGVPTDGIESAKELMARVDKAMYQAKKAGRNTSTMIKT